LKYANKLKKKIILLLCLCMPFNAFAIIGDGGAGWAQIPYIIKILAENVKRYKQLRLMITQAKDHKQYLRLINSGLENSIGLINSLPIKDEKILAELRTFKKSYDTILDVYGKVPKSKEELLHTLHDQTVAESLRMVNSFKDFARKQDENSIMLNVQSRNASPKGAARMQVEASSNILRSLNQLIKVNGQMLKMQSEILAMTNKNGKDNVIRYQKIDQDLRKGFKNFNFDMKLATY